MLILIVEDEVLVNLDAVEFFTDHGHQALSAYNADKALELLEANPNIEVIFTDIDMPGSLNGLGLARLAVERWPDIRLVVTTGKQKPHALPSRAAFVPKPYDLDQVHRLTID